MLSGAAAWGIISATVVELSLASYSVVITASTIASATGSFVSATNWALESLQNKFVVDFTKAGYTKLLPGQTYTTRKPIGLNMRAWVIRIQRRDNCVVIQKANGSVFSSRRPGKISTYRITDRRGFRNWRDENLSFTRAQRRDVRQMIAPEVMTRTKDFKSLDQIKISVSGRQ